MGYIHFSNSKAKYTAVRNTSLETLFIIYNLPENMIDMTIMFILYIDHTIVIPLVVTNLLQDHIQKIEDDVKENETHHFIIHQ
ncbi:hypothetical protein ACJX0J_020592, partial [Zea mays]